MIRFLASAALLAAAAPAGAEIVQSSALGFEVSNSVTVAATPDKAWPVVTAPRLWWDKDHTYSEDPANLTLDERPGGCFCEKLPGKGGVEHMRVVYIQPPQMLRMTGGIGPLQAEGATGVLAITLAREGEATKITMSYVAGGYIRAGGEKIAPVMDRVLGQQLAGLKAALDRADVGSTQVPAATPAAKRAAAGKPATPRIDAEPLADVGATISELPTDGTASDTAATPLATDASQAATTTPPKPLPPDWDSPR